MKFANTSANNNVQFEHTSHDTLLTFFISKSLQTVFWCTLSASVILPYLSDYKNCLFEVMMLPWLFPNYPYIHEDKHLFATTNKLIVVILVRKCVCIKKSFLKFFIKLVLIIFVITQTLYSITSSLKFVYWREKSQYLYLIPQISHFLSAFLYLHLMLWIPSERLLQDLVMSLP